MRLMAKGSARKQVPKPDLRERVAKLEGRLDAMASAFAELTSRMEKVEVIVPNLKPEPRIPTR